MKIIKILISILVLIMTGCSSSKITTSWKDKSIAPKYFKKIIVIGVMRDNDRAMQERMENHLVADLKDIGYSALSSLNEYGPNAFKKGDTAAAIIKLKESDADAVLTIVLLDKEKEQQYIAANNRNRFTGYNYEMYERIYEAGYYVTNTKYFWETNLYNFKTKKLIYSAQTESFNPDDVETLAHQYGKLIIKNMLKEHIFITVK